MNRSKQAGMGRKATLVLLLGLALASVAEGQQFKKIHKIGVLSAPSRSAQSARHEAFRQGLRDLGYVEGKNIIIEWRYAEGKLERLPELAAELVGLKVDVVVAGGTPAARAAKEATTTIPIVMSGGDPVRAGIVASLARPGGNVTGLSDATVDVSTKRLELLKEVVPKLSRVAILWNPLNPTNPLQVKDTQAAAPALGMTVYAVEVKGINELEGAFMGIKREHVGGLLVPGDPMFTSNRKRMADLAAKHRLPAMFTAPEYAEAGGLMAYGEDPLETHRRLATYVDKILKGSKPADLPVEAPMKFELVINLQTAKQIGLTIPQSLLYRADKVIK